MVNIPVFTTDVGVATLILREIPQFGRAYVLPRSFFGAPEVLVRECAAFCRSVGAERVDVQLSAAAPGTAFSCEIWELTRPALPAPESGLLLEPLGPEMLDVYRALYNRRFRAVDNAASCSAQDAREAAQKGAYLLLEQGEAIGLGQIWDGELYAVAAGRPGLGYALTCALLQKAVPGPVRLQVASSNAPALRLYERLDFEKTGVRSRWFRVLPEDR